MYAVCKIHLGERTCMVALYGPALTTIFRSFAMTRFPVLMKRLVLDPFRCEHGTRVARFRAKQ